MSFKFVGEGEEIVLIQSALLTWKLLDSLKPTIFSLWSWDDRNEGHEPSFLSVDKDLRDRVLLFYVVIACIIIIMFFKFLEWNME